MPNLSAEFWIGSILAVLLSIIAFGLGVGMDSKTRGEYWFVISCFCVSWLVIVAMIGVWDVNTTTAISSRALVSIAFVALASFGLFEALRWAQARHERVAGGEFIASPGPRIQETPSSQSVQGEPHIARTAPIIVDLMFKDTALLTPERKKRITDDINRIARYLKALGIPIPDDVPPIGVDTKNPKGEGWSFNSQSDNKYYYNQFTLQQGVLDKQTKITEAFLSFVVGRFIYKPPPPMPPNAGQMTPQQFWESTHTPEAMDQPYRWMTSVVVVQYLNHSYWNRPFAENEKPVCPDRGNGMSYYLWQMRERFGKEFADRLAVFTLRASVDKPYTGAHADAVHPYRYYFYERLTLADSVIDNENSNMPAIDSILRDCGWLPLT